jgi:hydrogenase maturation protease
MAEIAIIGIGNSFRGDDGAGWAVIEVLERKMPAQIKLSKIRGEIAEILEYFENYPAIYLIDACVGNAPAGTWKRLDALVDPVDFEQPQTSTHGLSLSHAISLAKNLNQLPSKLIIYAIYGNHYATSQGLSSKVAEAIPCIVQSILKEEDIQLCMKKV